MKSDSWKQPRSTAIPKGEKRPAIASDPTSFNKNKACWRVGNAQLVEPYSWHQLKSDQVVQVRNKLASFESMTWNQIFIDSKKQNHEIAVKDLKCIKARRWMATHMPDQTSLWTLRLSGKERVWGILAGGVYQIVFWDPEHLIYPTSL